jgi:hypothetical protein
MLLRTDEEPRLPALDTSGAQLPKLQQACGKPVLRIVPRVEGKVMDHAVRGYSSHPCRGRSTPRPEAVSEGDVAFAQSLIGCWSVYW